MVSNLRKHEEDRHEKTEESSHAETGCCFVEDTMSVAQSLNLPKSDKIAILPLFHFREARRCQEFFANLFPNWIPADSRSYM